MYTVLLVIHTILVVFLIGMILIQRSDSDGLGGLGGGGNQFLTGRSSANLLTRTTAILAGLFMLTSLVLAVIAGNMTSHSIIDAVPAIDAPQTEEPLTKDEAPKADKAAKPEKTKAPSVPKPE